MVAMLTETMLRFHAMGTDVQAIVVGPPVQQDEAQAALARVEALFTQVEASLSRFRPDSELSRMNASVGQPFQSAPVMFAVVQASLEAARATDGLFDPTVLGSLLAAGYDRTFEELPTSGKRRHNAPSAPHYSWRDVRLDATYGTVLVPSGCGIDLGGIAKGWTTDQAAQGLRRFPGYAVDAGGDIALGGIQVDGSPWTVGVANPFEDGRDVAVLMVADGAVCTSTTVKRRWLQDGQPRHHLIDPRTGQPSESNVASATVAAQTAARAEVLAKVALLLGAEAGLHFLDAQPNVQGVLVLQDGNLRFTSGLMEAQRVA